MDPNIDHLVSSVRDILANLNNQATERERRWAEFWKRADKVAPWLRIAYGELGQKTDLASGEQNPRVKQYLDSCSASVRAGLDSSDDEVPWCSAFVNWCLEQCGYIGTDNALSTSWLTWPLGRPISGPKLGAIVVTRRPSGAGHVGFVWNPTEPRLTVLGGNQGDPGQVKLSHINISSQQYELRGYIWPTTLMNATADSRSMIA